MVTTEASAALLTLGTLAGLGGGWLAVWLARIVPQRMEVEERSRPVWWWGIAIVIGGLYGWMVADAAPARAVIPAFVAFGAATLALTLIDLDHQLIPNRVLFPSIGIAGGVLAIGAVTDGASSALLRGVAGGIAYFLGLLAFALIARGGFGMGDVKLALLLGLFLGYVGWGELALGAVLAVLLGGIASVLLLVSRTKGRDSKFAYGPYLVIGAWIAIIWGEQILEWYLR
jgi:leader peptidase (prepilin peptidase)/N-methyltransferase